MVEYDFSDKVAFVTGAARGQGASHAVSYAEHGADVVVTDICENMETVSYDLGTREELEDTASRIEAQGQDALVLEMDVREEAEVESAVDEALDEFGRIDFLANNAGVLGTSPVLELEEEKWDEMLDTNLKGVWLCAKHVGRHYADRDGPGKIISTVSTGGFRASLGEAAHYGAAKWGIRGLTKTLAIELAEHDVNANCVVPTGIDTAMVRGMAEEAGEEVFEQMQAMSGPSNIFEPGETIEVEDVSEAYMWLSSEAARYVTGSALKVDAGDLAK